MMHNRIERITPLRHAARFGLILGLYFVFKYICFMYSLSIPLLGLIYLVATMLVPFLAYRITRNYRSMLSAETAFPLMVGWAHGTLLYAFASIVVLLAHYYFYAEALPSQLSQIEYTLNTLYGQVPNMHSVLTDLYGGEPIAILKAWVSSYSIPSLLWADLNANLFWGALLSLVNATLLRRSTNKA